MKFGGRVVTDVTLLNIALDVETADGRHASGFGSMPMSNVWAWPSKTVPGDAALAAMVALGERLARAAGDLDLAGHPLELTHALADIRQRLAGEVTAEAGLAEPMPRLAALVAASPLEAAIHDAYGRALGANSYDLLGAEYVNADIGHYLGAEFAGEYLDRYTLRQPKPSMPLYHLVGALDPLTDADLTQRLDDGLPETLPEWIAADGLTHLKIKLNGDDLAWDVQRVAAVERVAAEAQAPAAAPPGATRPISTRSAQTSSMCSTGSPSSDEKSPRALERLQYIEQPTSRDLRANPDNKMHAAAHQAGGDRRGAGRL